MFLSFQCPSIVFFYFSLFMLSWWRSFVRGHTFLYPLFFSSRRIASRTVGGPYKNIYSPIKGNKNFWKFKSITCMQSQFLGRSLKQKSITFFCLISIWLCALIVLSFSPLLLFETYYWWWCTTHTKYIQFILFLSISLHYMWWCFAIFFIVVMVQFFGGGVLSSFIFDRIICRLYKHCTDIFEKIDIVSFIWSLFPPLLFCFFICFVF